MMKCYFYILINYHIKYFDGYKGIKFYFEFINAVIHFETSNILAVNVDLKIISIIIIKVTRKIL